MEGLRKRTPSMHASGNLQLKTPLGIYWSKIGISLTILGLQIYYNKTNCSQPYLTSFFSHSLKFYKKLENQPLLKNILSGMNLCAQL